MHDERPRQRCPSASGRTRRTIAACLAASAASLGCSGDDRGGPGSTSAGTQGPLLEVTATAPRGAAGNVWLLILRGGEVLNAGRAPAGPMVALVAPVPDGEEVDVVVHVPDAAGWTPAEAPGSGLYATRTAVAGGRSGALQVLALEAAPSWQGETLGDLAGPDEAAWGMLEGEVLLEGAASAERHLLLTRGATQLELPLPAESGAFEIEVPRGQWEVQASAPGFAERSAAVEIVGGGTASLEVTLPEADGASVGRYAYGVVRSAGGDPIEGAEVWEGRELAGLTDEEGGYEIYMADESWAWSPLEIVAEHHARPTLRYVQTSRGDEDVEQDPFVLEPLPEELYGRWEHMSGNTGATNQPEVIELRPDGSGSIDGAEIVYRFSPYPEPPPESAFPHRLPRARPTLSEDGWLRFTHTAPFPGLRTFPWSWKGPVAGMYALRVTEGVLEGACAGCWPPYYEPGRIARYGKGETSGSEGLGSLTMTPALRGSGETSITYTLCTASPIGCGSAPGPSGAIEVWDETGYTSISITPPPIGGVTRLVPYTDSSEYCDAFEADDPASSTVAVIDLQQVEGGDWFYVSVSGSVEVQPGDPARVSLTGTFALDESWLEEPAPANIPRSIDIQANFSVSRVSVSLDQNTAYCDFF